MRLQGEGLKYQWHKDGSALERETAAAATLLLSSPCVEDCGFYHVVVSNEAGAVQSARVHVIIKPESVRPLQAAVSMATSLSRAGRAAARRRKLREGQLQQAASMLADSPSRLECASAPAPMYSPVFLQLPCRILKRTLTNPN